MDSQTTPKSNAVLQIPPDVLSKFNEIRGFTKLRAAFESSRDYQRWRRIFHDYGLIGGVLRNERLAKNRETRKIWRRANKDRIFKHNMAYFVKKAQKDFLFL